jgi:hypothetical protein
MAISSLDNIQYRLPAFYDKYNEDSVLHGVIGVFADVDDSRNRLIDRVNNAIGIDTTHDEDLQYRWGNLLSIDKRFNESYAAYRNRLKMAYPSLIGGTEDAIIYAIASAIGVTDSQNLIDGYIGVYDAWENYNGTVDAKTGTSIQSLLSRNSFARITKIDGASSQVVTVQGKNLFDKLKTQYIGQSVAISTGNLYADATSLTTYYIPISPSTSYIFSHLKWGAIYDVNKQFISGFATVKFTTPSNAYFVRYTMLLASIDTFQLELGSTATAYAPFIPNSPSLDYQSPIITANNFNITASNGIDTNSINIPYTIGSLPNGTKDTIEAVDDVLNHVKKTNVAIFDGSTDENWVLAQTLTNTLRFTCSAVLNGCADVNTLRMICDKLICTLVSDQNDYEHIRNAATGSPDLLVVYINKSRLITPNVTGLRTLLASNPLTVQYELATPIYTPITELILASYKGMTNITTTASPQVSISSQFMDDVYSAIRNVPTSDRTYGNILCTIDLTIGQDAIDIEQKVIDAINIVKASGIKPHILYIGIKVVSYIDMSRFNYSSFSIVSYDELVN